MKSGEMVEMPSSISDFSTRSHRTYQIGDSNLTQAQLNSLYLERIMIESGFQSHPHEWWHFDLVGWEKYESQDIPI